MLTIEKKILPPDVVVLEIAGRIVLGRACQNVEWQVEDLLKENRKKVVLDLSKVSLVDSTGVGIVVMCLARLKRAGGELRIAGATGKVEEVFRLTNLDKVTPFYPTAAAATEKFGLP